MAVHKLTPTVQSLDRGLILLDAVAQSRRPVSLPELTRLFDIDRSSIFRLVNTLVQRGFLSQVPGSKDYVPGPAVWRMTSQLESNKLLAALARGDVLRLAEESGETTHLVVRNGLRPVFIENEPTSHRVGVSTCCGDDDPLHCTSVGKALLADFERQQLIALFGDEPLATPTKRSIRSIDALVDECKRTRKRGFAIDDEEMSKGVRCVAAPIRDSTGAVIAAIGISAPGDRLSKKRCIDVGQQIRQVAQDISGKLGIQVLTNELPTHKLTDVRKQKGASDA